MAQFRVEFVLDQATGKYLAELYNPDNQQELLVRTEALYPSQAAAVGFVDVEFCFGVVLGDDEIDATVVVEIGEG